MCVRSLIEGLFCSGVCWFCACNCVSVVGTVNYAFNSLTQKTLPSSLDRQQPTFNMSSADSMSHITTIDEECAAVDRFLAIVRSRLQAELSILPKGIVRNALDLLKDVDSVKAFKAGTKKAFGSSNMHDLAKAHRYPLHMLGALKGLLEISESFRKRPQTNQQDYRPIQTVSPRGDAVVCWIQLRGNGNKDRRVYVRDQYYVCLAMVLLEAKMGKLLVTKSQKSIPVPPVENKHDTDDDEEEKVEVILNAKGNEETSHRCHQALCVKPAHLVGEMNVDNFRRINCGALATCHHDPKCLLPHRDTRKGQFDFVNTMIAEFRQHSPHRSKMHPKKKQRTA